MANGRFQGYIKKMRNNNVRIQCVFMLFAVIWCCWNMHVTYRPTAEEVERNWQSLKRAYPDVMPETRPTGQDPNAIDRFYTKQVNPVWQAAMDSEDYSMEGYYVALDQVVQLCKTNSMPFRTTFTKFMDAYGKAGGIGWRTVDGYSDWAELSMDRCDTVMNYETCYSRAVKMANLKINWAALGFWLLTAYLKSMAISMAIFVFRIIISANTRLRDELMVAPRRFIKMVLVWPYGLCIYPNWTIAAIAWKRTRLTAEFLRDKPIGHCLSGEEKEWLEKLARQSSINLKLLLSAISNKQVNGKRKSLIFIYMIMIAWLFASSLLRLGSVCAYVLDHSVSIGIVMVITETIAETGSVADALARDGPNQDRDDHSRPTSIMLAGSEILNTTSMPVLEIVKALRSWIGCSFEHIPISPKLVVLHAI